MDELRVNALIVGGGVSGLWLLDQLRREGHSAVLAEASALGSGQTISAQGILHSGLKYSLQGLLTNSAREAREMPALWRSCLAGRAEPNLSATEVRSDGFYLWGTSSAASRIGMLGARLGLQVTPQAVAAVNAPQVLSGCSGSIFRVAEQVISCESLLDNLAARNQRHLMHVDKTQGVRFETRAPGEVTAAILSSPGQQRQVRVVADWVVLCAGQGNTELRNSVGLDSHKQQLRPLHMVMVTGGLHEFYGHCVEGATTRISITSTRMESGEIVWQVGGQLAEEGVRMDRMSLLMRAKYELLETLPGIHLDECWWSTYRVSRAEGITLTRSRPDTYRLDHHGNVLTAWPTKLVLVPQMAAAASEYVEKSQPIETTYDAIGDWPLPPVARPPWQQEKFWTTFDRAQNEAA